VYSDLLKQAVDLATRDAKRPKQVNLRRAVSATYYAIFHLLVDEACRVMLGSQHEQAPYRHVLARAFTHGSMKAACTSFAGSTLKAAVAKGLPASFAVPAQIRAIARAFAELQEQRNLADYDLTERFSRSAVLTLIEQTATAIEDFRELPTSNEKKFFLVCLWAWTTLVNR
jgi:hypothetical protein